MKVMKDYIQALTVVNATKEIVNAHSVYTKSLIGRPIAVTHVEFDSKAVINENELDSLDSGVLRSVITAFWTSKYGGVVPTPSTVNAYITAFKEYVETATRMTGRFLCMKRCQDQWNLDNDDYGQIGQVFCNPVDMNIANLDPIITTNSLAYTTLEATSNARLSKVDTVFGDFTQSVNSISSTKWTREFTTPLKNVLLPVDVITLLNIIFGCTIELSSDDDETLRYVQFWQTGAGSAQFPGTTEGSIANFLTAYNNDYAQIQSLFSAYPMLRDILEAMEYVTVLDCVNVRRDLSGKTLHVIRDHNDQLEYAIRSVLLAQSDRLSNNDIINNSIIMDVKQPYLQEAVTTTPFNAIARNLYNMENFMRGKVAVTCVSILEIIKYGNATNTYRNINCYCGDNLTVYSDARTNADWTRWIASAEDSVTETDALVSSVLHAIAIDANNNISIASSYVETSSKVYISDGGIIANLLFCVNSGLYIDQPKALAALTKTTLYETALGATNYITFGDSKKYNPKNNEKKENKKDKKDKQELRKSGSGSKEAQDEEPKPAPEVEKK